MKIYLDTSVILRYLLNQKPLIEGWGMWDEVWTSELMGLEARRTFDRLRLTGYLDDLGVVAAMVLKEERVSDLVFGTQDDQQALAARALGFRVSG